MKWYEVICLGAYLGFGLAWGAVVFGALMEKLNTLLSYIYRKVSELS